MDPQTSAPDKRLAQLSNTMAMFNLANGWPSDRERHHQARLRLKRHLQDIAGAEFHTTDHRVDLADREKIEEIDQHNLREAEGALALVRRLEKLRQTDRDGSLGLFFDQAIGRIKELSATLFLMAGSDEYLKLGFSIVPTIEAPPPESLEDVEALFRTG